MQTGQYSLCITGSTLAIKKIIKPEIGKILQRVFPTQVKCYSVGPPQKFIVINNSPDLRTVKFELTYGPTFQALALALATLLVGDGSVPEIVELG